jgi:hypothetical protein
MAYEIVKPKNEEVRFEIEYRWESKIVSIPRFINLPANASQNEMIKAIEKSIKMYKK